MENIAKATIEVFQKSAEMNSSNPSGNGAAAQGGSASNNNSTTSKMKPILRCVSPRVLLKFVFLLCLDIYKEKIIAIAFGFEYSDADV